MKCSFNKREVPVEELNMVDQRTWDEFRECGLLWFINSILHVFGWAICMEMGQDGRVQSAYPERVKYRGFSGDINDLGYRNVAKYLKENGNSIYEDAMEN